MNTNELKEKLNNIEKALKQNNATPMNFEDTAKYLNVSKSHLYKLTSKGIIPHYKPGGKMIYFEKSELDSWILKKRITPNTELEKRANKYINGK